MRVLAWPNILMYRMSQIRMSVNPNNIFVGGIDKKMTRRNKCLVIFRLLTFWLVKVILATAAYNFWTSELQKVLRDQPYFKILTCERASRHGGVQSWNIRTSKSAPRPSVEYRFWLVKVLLATGACNFSTWELQKLLRDRQLNTDFDLWMCVSPQLRTIFRHQNFKTCSETVSFLTFWLVNVLLAKAAYNFSTSELPKVPRDRQFF